MLDNEVRLLTPGGSERQVGANRAARGTVAVEPVRGDATAWIRGVLEVDDQPLGEIIDALRAYRCGVLRIAPDAARLRVSGIFPLDDTERTSFLLENNLPITVSRRSDYWVTIELA